MLCESCGQYDANVHVTHVLKDAARELHLCETCAAKNGINIQAPASLSDILIGLDGAPVADRERADKKCPFCAMGLDDLRKTSRIGCAVCYETFRTEIGKMLAGLQKGTQHVGKVPATQSVPEDPRISELQAELESAIAGEHYEKAAELRDEILMLRARVEGERREHHQ